MSFVPKRSPLLVFIFAAASLTFGARIAQAQLVADGATNVISGFTTNLTGDLIVGTNGSFTRLEIVDGGIVTNSGHGYIGQNFNSSSNQVEIAGLNSSWQMGGNLSIGNRIGGPYNQLVIGDGASVSCSNANIGGYSKGGSIAVVGGSLSAGFDVAVGTSGNSNSLMISKGGQVTDVSGRIGPYIFNNYQESHMVLVSDPGSLWTNASVLYIGEVGAKHQLVISNGGTVINSDGFIGYRQPTIDNIAKVTGPGSVWDNRNDLYIGDEGKGNQMIISNGGVVYNNGGYIGRYRFSSNNMVTVSGQGSVWNCRSDLTVGYFGSSNVMMITNGGTVQCANCTIGFNFDFSNAAIVNGSGSTLIIQTNLVVGYQSGDDRLIVTNGAVVEVRNLYVGYFPYNFGGDTVLIDNSSVIVTNLVDVRQGTLLLSSGLLTTAALWLTNSYGKIVFNGGTLQSGSTIHDTGSPMVVGGSATPAAFELLDYGSHLFAGGLLVASNGLVKGNGSITGNVTVAAGGAISPGASIGQLAINGDLVLSNGSTTVMELDAVAGTNDSFSGLTGVTYGGTLRVSNVAGVLTNGSKFKLFTAANYSNAFDALDAPNLGPGLKWNTSQLTVDGTLRVVATPSPTPAITSTVLTSNNLIISGSGGVAFDPCYLLTSTNVAQPVAEWVRLVTNRFDSSGNVNLTSPVLQNERGRYFRLAVD